MKKVSFYLISLFLLTGIIACQKETSMPEERPATVEKKEGIRIPVRMENTVTKSSEDEFVFGFEDETKVDISSSTGVATWTAGDQIALCESNGVNMKYLIADVDESTNEISVTIDDGYSRANYAIYPASAAGTNYTTPTVVYADSYDMDGVTNMETFSMAPMVAVNNSGDLDFYHVGGVLRLNLVGVPTGTRKIRVTFNGISYVTGTYTVSNPGTSSMTTTIFSGSHNFVDFRKLSEDFSSDTYLNIPLPQGSYVSCTGMTVTCYDFGSSTIGSNSVEFPWLSLGRARGKKTIGISSIDLSLINPLTGASMSRETANCYIVTAPGCYCIPLFYGNTIVNGSDNLYTAAPPKVNTNDGVFVNAYDLAISNGNIKEDLESTSKVLNTSGGKLIWSTKSAKSNALVIVKSEIKVVNGIGYLFFSVPSARFAEGSALIGVLKSGSTTEYVWAWHIWITDGSVLATDAYTNYQSQTIDMLNRPLGGRGGTSLVNTYYQYGMPFPLPPSNGSNNNTATLYDENGTYTFNYDSDNTITTLGKALSKPYLPRWNNGFFNDASGSAQAFYNMWDATLTAITNKIVVKTIYDPSPAGMTVPPLKAFTGFTTTGLYVTSGAPTNCNVVGSFTSGWKFKRTTSDVTGIFWAASGTRNSGSTPANVSSVGYFWSACPSSSSYGYYLVFNSYSVSPENGYLRSNAYSVRPALSEIP